MSRPRPIRDAVAVVDHQSSSLVKLATGPVDDWLVVVGQGLGGLGGGRAGEGPLVSPATENSGTCYS